MEDLALRPGGECARVPAGDVVHPSAWRRRLPELRAKSISGQAGDLDSPRNLLTPEEQELLLTIGSIIEYPAGGCVIFSEGEDAHFIYVIEKGIVRISRYSENGQRQILAFRARGDLCGLPDVDRYVNSAETVSPAKVFRFPWRRFQQLLVSNHSFQAKVFAKVTCDFRQAQRRIMMLGHQNIYQRLASFLLEFVSYPEFFDDQSSALNLPVNRFDLADFMGTTPESTARAFARLESEGLVRRANARTIEILDPDGLHQLQSGRRRASRLSA